MKTLRALGLISCFLLAPSQAGAQTPLADLAKSMQSGTWATLTTTNINTVLGDAQAISGYIIDYSEDLVWDPVTRRLFFLGGGHYASGTPVMKHVQYDEATNAWSVLPQQSWFVVGSSHAYDHLAIDPTHRHFYHRSPSQLVMHRWNIDTGVWTDMAQNNLMIYNACCIGIEYFPELNGVIWAADESDNQGGLTKLDVTSGTWSRVGSAKSYQMSPLHNYAEYNPVHKVMIFGGGNPPDSRTVWKLNASGQVTRMQDAPEDLGTTHSVVTVDPVSGDYLVFTTAQHFYVYNVLTDTWTFRATGASVPIWTTSYANPIFEVIGTPISTYGVNVFVTCDGPSKCRVNLYKHSGVSNTTTPDKPTGVLLK